MIAGLKPYPAYKDSGVPWLGEVPEHWQVASLRHLVTVRSGEAPPADKAVEGRYPVFGANGVIGRASRFNSAARRVVVGRVGTAGAVNVTPPEAWITDNVLIVDPASNGVTSDYLPRLLGALDLASLTSQSAQPLITGGHIKARKGALPPLLEQAAIVRFLHYVDRRIRRYIRAKQKLIGLLEEQKQAIIHRAVTRGLDPNVRLKPSGVEWLGDVPEHWELLPLKSLCRKIQNGATPPTSDESFYSEGTVPWFGPSNIGPNPEVRDPVRHLAASAFAAGKARLIRGPAILIVVIGATAGRMALLMGDGSTNQQITAYELRTERILPDFAIRQLRGAEVWLRSTASTATIPILDSGTVARLSAATPPVPEQQGILERLADLLRPFQGAAAGAEREIALLREYRTRLIADVVTGKLDVREAAARLPDEMDEQDVGARHAVPLPFDDGDGDTENGEEVDDADADTVGEEAEA